MHGDNMQIESWFCREELYHLLVLLLMFYLGCVKHILFEKLWRRLKTCFFPSSGCLGCCSKPAPIIAVDEPSKGLKIQGRIVEKQGGSDDFWSTSTYEMDNSAVQSMRSISSISTSTQAQDQHGATSTGNSFEFVNHGLLLWNQTRQQWIGNKRPDNKTRRVREPRLSWNATYESLLATNKPFRQPIPLSEMVDFLVDVWEQEGLYD